MLEPEQITVVIDTREQLPFDLVLPNGNKLKTARGTLTTGDYSVMGLENEIAIERKSLPDLIMCVGTERQRFEDELHRLLAYRTRCVIVEASWMDIEAHNYRSRLNPQSAIGSILKWIAGGIPFVLAGTRVKASEYAARMLYGAARCRHSELTQMLVGEKPRRRGKVDLEEAV